MKSLVETMLDLRYKNKIDLNIVIHKDGKMSSNREPSGYDLLYQYFDLIIYPGWASEKSCGIKYSPDGNPLFYVASGGDVGYVYFMKCGDAIKIGKTKDLDRRIKQISPVLPYDLELIHAIKTDIATHLERAFHYVYKEKRLNGEWFALTKEDLFNIKTIRNGEFIE